MLDAVLIMPQVHNQDPAGELLHMESPGGHGMMHRQATKPDFSAMSDTTSNEKHMHDSNEVGPSHTYYELLYSPSIYQIKKCMSCTSC